MYKQVCLVVFSWCYAFLLLFSIESFAPTSGLSRYMFIVGISLVICTALATVIQNMHLIDDGV